MKDFSHRKTNKRAAFLLLFVMLVSIIAGITYNIGAKKQPIILEVALYSGDSWNVPQKNAYTIYDEAARLFEEAYADQNVQIVFRSGRLINDYSEWFAEQVLMGNEADVFLVLEEDFSTYASIGLLEDLTPYIEKDNAFRLGDYYSKALMAGQYYGQQYALPFEVAPTFLVVNRSLLKQENLDISAENWTWDTFYDVCASVTKDLDGDGQLDQFGVYDYGWENAFYTNDEMLFPNDGSNVAYNDDRMTETISFMKKMYALNRGTVVQESDFDDGKVAFKIFSLPEYRAYATYPYRILKYENFEWEAIPLPSGPNGSRSSKLYTVQMGMSSRSKNKDLAYEFIKFATNQVEVQQKVWEETYALPALRSVVESIYNSNIPEVRENKVVNASFLEEIIDQSYADPHFKKYASMKTLMNQQIFQIIAQDMDIPAGLKELRQELKKKIIE